MFSPPFLIIKPPPSPRSSQATRLVTSNAPSTPTGLMTACTHFTSSNLSAVCEPHFSQSSSGGAGGGGGGGGVGGGGAGGAGGTGAGGVGAGGWDRRRVWVPETGPRHVVPEYGIVIASVATWP